MTTYRKAFTLIELLVVISVISVLSSVLLVALSSARDKAYMARAMQEFRLMETALKSYSFDHGDQYPADGSRDILPNGLGPYLFGSSAANAWPKAPWPGSVYDWDNWDDPDNPGQKIYQISIRFCPSGGGLSTCRFPSSSWANNFGVDSAVYYCIFGFCRSHQSQPYSYPGYCVNKCTP